MSLMLRSHTKSIIVTHRLSGFISIKTTSNKLRALFKRSGTGLQFAAMNLLIKEKQDAEIQPITEGIMKTDCGQTRPVTDCHKTYK